MLTEHDKRLYRALTATQPQPENTMPSTIKVPPRRPYQARTVYYAGATWRISNHYHPRLINVIAVRGTRFTSGIRRDMWPAA